MTETTVGTDSPTHRPVAADAAKRIKAKVTFTDDDGHDEELESAVAIRTTVGGCSACGQRQRTSVDASAAPSR